jgi:TonB-linked SusC/RagA family outer membrane protein
MRVDLLQNSVLSRCHPPYKGKGRLFNRKLLFPIYLLAMVLLSIPAWAQTLTVTGRITDATGEMLPGVTVKVKEAAVSTITDANGKYSINIPNANSTLVFTFIGLTTQEIRISGQSIIDVVLRDDQKTLNDVVVIGYQTVRKKDLTGAVAVVNASEANKISSNSVAESLQGLSPGLTVRTTGAPGSNASVTIRGVASFNNTDPLYIIDGMYADANSTVNTDDIETIQVLKDASAAAIYGSRAGNGVIIITTKKGKKGPAKINASAKYGVQQVRRRWDVMDAPSYAALQRQSYINSGLTPAASVGDQYNPAINTDWQDETLRTGNLQDYNVSISGGSDNTTYLASASYLGNKGTVIGNKFDRTAFRINSETKKGILTFGENMVLTNSRSSAPNAGNPWYDMPQQLPVLPVQSPAFITADNPAGYGIGNNNAPSYAWNYIAINDYARASSNFAKLVGNAFVDLKLASWLNYRFNVGAEVSYDNTDVIRKTGIWAYAQALESNYISNDRQRFTNFLMEHTLNFNKAFGSHSINGVVGYTQQDIKRILTSARRNGIQSYEGVDALQSANGASAVNGSVPVNNKLRGYLGRVNYNYADRYLITLTGRIDQDSRFGTNYRTGFFPSVAAAWRISKEKFFNVGWVNDLKISGSYGRLGFNTIGSYDSQAFINFAPRAVFGNATQVGATQTYLNNNDLRWERREDKNVGIDATLFNNSLTVGINAYDNLSKDILVGLAIPLYLGASGAPQVNAGSIRNRGLEFEATYRNNKHDFKWELSGNVTTIKNKLLSVGSTIGTNYIQTGATRSEVGQPIGQFYLIQANGLFQSQAEINNYKNSNGVVIQPSAKPGDVKFVDANGDGQITDADRQYSGSAFPSLQSGMQFNGSYKQFSIGLQLVSVTGFKLFNDVRRILDSYANTNFRADVNPWTPTNTNTSDPRIGIQTNDPGLVSNALYSTTRWLENGSYLRVRNLELGYSFSKSFLNKFNVDNARLFVSGQNLFTITQIPQEPVLLTVGSTQLPGPQAA